MRIPNSFKTGLALAALCTVTAGPVLAQDAQSPALALDKSAHNVLHECEHVTTRCKALVDSSYGVLVFPDVVKADIIIGGSGGKGALIEHGKITGYYTIGSGSVGLQLGVDHSSQVYIFRTPESLNNLKQSADWKVGGSSDVTLMSSSIDESKNSVSGDVLAYVFNSKGLNGGISLDAIDIWKSSMPRPN